MLTFLSKGDAQALIARHHDRLTRNAEDFVRLIKICGKSKIKISANRAIPYPDPDLLAERLQAVHEARVKIVPRV
jgi:hypothetical protein